MSFYRRNLIYIYAGMVAFTGVSLMGGQGAAGQTAERKPRIVAAVRNDQLMTLPGNVHPAARQANDRGVLPDQRPVTKMRMLLQRSAEQETALQQLMAQQLDPKSPKFHAWLTPQEFGQQFGPADSDIQAVKDWLSSQGFTDLKVNNGKTLIEFNGTAGAIRNAFHTEMHWLSVRGEEHFANMQEPKIPAALGPVVAGVAGLHNFHPKPLLRRLGKFQRNISTGEISPLFTYSNVNGKTFYGVAPSDFKQIYNVPSTFDGTGISIALVERSNIHVEDVQAFRSIFGLPAKDPEIIVNGPDPGVLSPDEEGEAVLDAEWAGAIATGADIKLVVSETSQSDGTDGVDESAVYIVDNNLADVVSESFGSCESDLGAAGRNFYSSLWQQASSQGMSVMVSSGDSGSAACDPPVSNQNEDTASQGLGVSGIASTAYNVAMGGTDFDQANNQPAFWNTCSGTPCSTVPPLSAKGYIPEMTWNDSCAAAGVIGGCASATTSTTLNFVAASGGASSFVPKPSWQGGVGGIPNDSHRDIPDVSLFASDGGPLDSSQTPTIKSFYIVCQTDLDIAGDTGCSLTKFVSSTTGPLHDFQAVGGTSVTAPTFAAIMALIDEKTGQRQGNPNPVLYPLAKNEDYTKCDSSSFTNPAAPPPTLCVFLDITKGNISVACAAGSPDCSSSGGSVGVMATSAGGSTLAYTAQPGYDLATGLGSVNVANLLNAWAALTRPDATTTLSATTTFPITHGSSAGFNVSVSPSAATGDVSLTGGPSASQIVAIGPFTLGGGNASISTKLLPGGTYLLNAHYAGDATHGGSDSNAVSVTINKESSLTTTSLITFDSAGNPISSNSTTAVYGSPYILRVDVTNGAGSLCYSLNSARQPVKTLGCPSGSVGLTDNGNALDGGTFTLNSTGYSEDQPIQLPVGTHKIVAAYSGDNSFSASTSATNTLNITIATTTTVLTPSTLTVASGGNVTLSAKVNTASNSAQGPKGTVQFFSGSTSLGPAANCTPTPADNVGTPSVAAFCTASLSATISSLPPGFDLRPRNTPFVILAWAAALLAILSFARAMRPAARRRQYAYAGVIFILVAVAAITGCGGGSSSTGGGTPRSLTAKYSGDSNYAASTSAAVTVTVQ